MTAARPLVVAVLALAAASCTTGRPERLRSGGPAPGRETVAPLRAPAPPSGAMTGRASWYGRPHHGKKTSSGEVYDQTQLTAAHRTLPMGTRVRVTNVDNGRAVVVRINDRGPFTGGRIIDVSQAAARELDALRAGVFTVRLEVLDDATPEPAAAARPR